VNHVVFGEESLAKLKRHLKRNYLAGKIEQGYKVISCPSQVEL
jgi:hypothetical protein